MEGFIASSFGTGKSFNLFLKADVQDRRRKLGIIYLRACVNWKYVARFLNKNSVENTVENTVEACFL